MSSSIQSMPGVSLPDCWIAFQIAVPMRAATIPTMIVTMIEMFCLPGATSRPRIPMIAPTMMAVMIPVTVM